MSKTYLCPFCGEELKYGNSSHIKKCDKFQEFINENKDLIYDLYYNKGKSMVDISDKLGIKYCHAQSIFNRLNFPIRGITESKKQEECKKKYKQTMLKNWGTDHNFNKKCKSRQEWEQRLFENEGITNVFQREEVKEKIKNTIKEKYTDNEIYNNYVKGSKLEYWVEKLGEIEGLKKYNKINYNKGKSNRMSYYIEKYGQEKGVEIYKNRIHTISSKNSKGYHTSINEGFKTILEENNIQFKREFPIRRIDDVKKTYCYDFLIENELIVEMNGRFWHADPRWYKENDVLNFPGRKKLVKDIWLNDKNKKDLAISSGYKFITIWEDDFNHSDKNEILKIIQNGISKDKKNN